MDAEQIEGLGRDLMDFLSEFDDCFGRSEPREHLRTYVRGQLTDLPRKSIEPMALASGTPPRTLQRFVESVQWDEHRLRDRQQRIVARDHAEQKAIGVIDESGQPKKGGHTAAVQRQWCGRTGKLDNCVVGVHLCYVTGDFQCLLDSDLFLPKDWATDAARRKEALIPEDVTYRKKADIALEQVQRALANGIRVAAWTFDEFYGRDGAFLDGLEALGQNYVAEVPADFTGWVREPEVLLRPTPQEMRKQGRRRLYPRLARKTLPACEVRNLVRYSPVFQQQEWEPVRIKEGENGPMVWEIMHARFYRKKPDGLVGPVGYLIAARNALNRDEVKYFVSNQLPGEIGVTLEGLLGVGFSRWPIERCFQQAKDELGMDHFEVRGWRAIHRHLYITQLSHLFCVRAHQTLREKKDRQLVPDGGTSSHGRLRLGPGTDRATFRTAHDLPGDRGADRLLSASQPTGPSIAHENDATTPENTRHQSRSDSLVCAG